MKHGETIKKLRKEQGLSQLELACRSGITQTTLSQIETGVSIPQSDTIKKICTGLGIEPTFLLLLSLNEDDVAPEKREAYQILMPAVRTLISEFISVKPDKE